MVIILLVGNLITRRYQNYWLVTSESFIFTLENCKNMKDVKISRVTNANCAIYESSYNDFTLNFGNSDLVINNQTGTCNQTNYESNILNSNTFSIEEMEIFSFTKVE